MITAETAGEMLERLGDDASKWAAEFVKRYPGVPEDEALGWFANAIEHSWSLRRSALIQSDEAWEDFKGSIDRERSFFAELQASSSRDAEGPLP